MKTIFQTGFRPANPFDAGINPFGSIRLGQYDDEGWTSADESGYTWPEEVPYPTYTYQETPYTPPTVYTPAPSEEDEWRSLQQTTTPTTPSQQAKKPSALEEIAKGIVTGGAGAAAAYAKAEAERAKQQGITSKPGMVPTITPGGAVPPSSGVSSTTILVGLGAAVLVTVVALAVA